MASTQIPSASPATPPTTSAYVLPAAPRGRSTLVIEREHHAAPPPADLGALRAAGSRIQALLECQQQFFGELRQSLAEIDASVHEATRARIKRQVAQLGEILEWCEAVQADLVAESQRAAAGWQPVDLGETLRQVAARWQAEASASVLVSGQSSNPWWGQRAELEHLLELALQVVAERIGGAGPIQVELGDGAAGHAIRMLGLGEAKPLATETLAGDFRAAALRLGVTVAPDALGAGGTGLVLRLPAPAGTDA